MAKKTCDCCLNPKPDLETKEWGRPLSLCATCRKQGRTKVLARVEAREAAAAKTPANQEPASAAPAPGEPKRATQPAEKTREVKAAAEPKARKPSVSSAVKELCDAGKTNEEIWPVIKERFSLPDEHKWYVAWYRRHHARKAEKAAAAAAKGATA